MRQALVWPTILLLLVLVGCSRSQNRRVWGEVSFKGVPIQDGSIELIPIEGTGGPSVGSPITEGAYDIPAAKGPLANGTYQVKLVAVRDTGRFPPGPRYAKSMTIREDIFPEEYNTKSKLQVKIDTDAARNRLDFHLPKSDLGSGK
jgi:hypothetical protein